MLETRDAAIGILIPFLGTALGACFAFFLRGEVRPWVQKLLLGFASGVMIAASVWSLIIPAIEMAEGQGTTPWLPAALGFLAGVGFLLLLDSLIPHLHLGSDCPEGRSCGLGKSTMLVLAVTLHNLPEDKIYRPHAWAAFGTQDTEAADFAACKHYGPLYR